MGAVLFAPQANRRDPFIDQTGILSGTYGRRVINPARKRVVIHRPTTPLKPCEQAGTSVSHQLELNGTACLLLHHGRTGSYFRADDQGADFDLYEIAATQLAIDGEIEQGAITHRRSRSRKKRIAHTWRGFSARFAPTFRPAFQARRSCAAGSYCESPMMFLLRPPLAKRRTRGDARSLRADSRMTGLG